MAQMHQCAEGLCGTLTILPWNRWATFNIVIIYHLIL